MKLRFLEGVKWPGRHIRPGTFADASAKAAAPPEQAAAAVSGTPAQELRPGAGRATLDPRTTPAVLQLIPPAEHGRVRSAFDQTRRRLAVLRRRAETELEKRLHIPVADNPHLAEAAAYLSGHHPDFGGRLPEVPSEHRTGGGAVAGPPSEITSQIYRRALGVVAHADRILYGFDTDSVVASTFDGTVPVYGGIESPAIAAGEVPPPLLPQRLPINTAIDKRMFLTIWELIEILFWHVMWFILSFIADLFDYIGDRLEGMFTIKILGKKIGVGGWIAWPFRQLASLFRRWADYFRRKAEGAMPRTPEEPVPTEPAEIVPAGGDPGREGTSGSDVEAVAPDPDEEARRRERMSELWQRIGHGSSWREVSRDQRRESTGLIFLMSAEHVIRAAQARAEMPGQEALLEALTLYHNAREADQLYDTNRSIARALGVDVDDLALVGWETAPVDGADEPAPSTGRPGASTPGTSAPGTGAAGAAPPRQTPIAETYASDDRQPFSCGSE